MPESDDGPTPIRDIPWPQEFASRILDEQEMQQLSDGAKEILGLSVDTFPNYQRSLVMAAKAGRTTGILEPVSFDIDSGDDALPVITWRVGTLRQGPEQVFIAYRSHPQPKRLVQLPYSETDLPWAEKFEATTIPGSGEVIRVSYWNPERSLANQREVQHVRPFTNNGAVALGLEQLADKMGFDMKRHSNKIQPK